ncbi:hypothetical protein Y032_0594g424 [Ancylostoma ceylanicum]|nr:hypothetical protein Y032_0594g424 [Ancylostoma ceylanicum]
MWTNTVKEKVQAKKQCYHAFLADKSLANWQLYRMAKKEAKKAVAAAKASRFEDLYRKLDTREGERDLYKLARTRYRQTQDVVKFVGVNDEEGNLITDRKKVAERWKRYFENICNEEFPHPPIPHANPVYGAVMPISVSEVEMAVKTMKPGRATGPDDVAAELWRSRHWHPAAWLAQLFNRIIFERKIPDEWKRSTTVPIWKKKGSPAECCNYRPIRLLPHTMKIFERIVDRRIREIVELSSNQCGFVKNCSTTNAIHAARLLVEKHLEKNAPLHVAFLDLEKAFDRVPHEVIWYSLRIHGVPEELVVWIKLLYDGTRSQVRTPNGTSEEFRVNVGVHQGSALSPLLFILVMDAITKDIQKTVPWTLLYADDVMLAANTKAELEQQVQTWQDRLADFGLRLNVRKTEYLTTDKNEQDTVRVSGEELPRTNAFKYLGSFIRNDASLMTELNARINAGWMKFRATSGIICDRKISDKLKSKIYRTVIRPAALYSSECWPATKEIERRLGVMEARMLRWASGITRLDHIRNEDIRKRYGLAPIQEKMREQRLRWLGHVLRASEQSAEKIAYEFEVSGKRPRGRPKQRWTDTLRNDLKIVSLHPDQAHERSKWRLQSRRADPASKRDKR